MLHSQPYVELPCAAVSAPTPPAKGPGDRLRIRLGTQINARTKGPWVFRAACHEIPLKESDRLKVFYDLDADGELRYLEAARIVCEGCPVRSACLCHAIVCTEDQGIWGGLVPDVRKRMRRYIRTHNLHPTPNLIGVLLATWVPLTKAEQVESIARKRSAQ